MDFIQNPALRTILPEWQGTPINEKGQFQNLYDYPQHDFRSFLRWQLGKKPQKAEKKADTWRANVQPTNDVFIKGNDDGMVWLGHASFLIRINGVTLLTDPIFGGMPFVPRKSALPFNPDDIAKLDYVLLSHNHRDHADKDALQRLAQKHPRFELLTGLKNDELVRPWVRGHRIQAAGWYQAFDLPQGISITYLPSRHWCRRGLTDFNEMLWGGFMIQIKKADNTEKCIYFAGDSGYDAHFSVVKTLFPTIDIAMIGCGAYKPDFIMQANHTSPQEAIQAWQDTGATEFVPMHYGTFDLADEPFGEPYRILQAAKNDFPAINILEIGEWKRL
jgi:L-ascorbate metabolism protein UlaG (beta-lactamase superfamily)